MNKVRGFEKISLDQFKNDIDYGKYNITYDDIIAPKRATSKSAGYDVFSLFDFILQPNGEIKMPTGIKAFMQDGEVLEAYPRSGHGFKYHIKLANTVGVIDADYFNNEGNEGHIWVKLRNEGSQEFKIKKGEAFCQMIFKSFLLADRDSFMGEERKGGFGSTNKPL